MKGMRFVAGTLAVLALLVRAEAADVRTIKHSQILAPPPGQTFTHFARNVAIDGPYLIVLATHDAGQSALLYQRSTPSSEFTYRKTLITFHYPREHMQVRMENGLAVVQFGDRAWFFERIGRIYYVARTATPLRHPGGVAISDNRILMGGDNCSYDGVVYEKRADGLWAITGRMNDNQGECHASGQAVDLDGDLALTQVAMDSWVNAWRRNGTALDWILDGAMSASLHGPDVRRVSLHNLTAVMPGSAVFRREGDTWIYQGYATPVDPEAGSSSDVVYRDGVLLTRNFWRLPGRAKPYAFLETAPGQFEHVAILETEHNTIDHDISGRTVVAALQGYGDEQQAVVFELPEPLAAPPAVANDFESRDISDITVRAGQFALATRGTDDVLAQSGMSNLSLALVEGTDWEYYQRIEADIAPTFSPSGGWAGLVARYIDANNFYFVTIRADNTFGIYRRLNGVNTLLREGTSAGTQPSRVKLIVDGDQIFVEINQQYSALTSDSSLPRGRAGLATFDAAADFDDVHVAATAPRQLLRSQYFGAAYPGGVSRVAGIWQFSQDTNGTFTGLRQLDANRSAFAVTGGQARNQVLDVAVRPDAVSSESAAWVGVLGRYIDVGNHYHGILRKTGRVEIRKQVNGVDTLLAAANLTVNINQFNRLRFRIIEDQLQLFLNEVHVLSARDDEIHEGQFGLATHRAAATWDHFFVTQP